MVQRILLVAAMAMGFSAALAATVAWGCPFCTATAQTFSEEIASMDAVVIAKLVSLPPPSQKAGDELARARFEISHVIKGKSLAKPGEAIETLYFGDGKPGQKFLVMGVDAPKIMWSTPLPLSARAEEYIGQLLKLPKAGNERLLFFQNYLEDGEEMLARDAYDEFAKAPYSQVVELKDHINHEQVVAWVKNPEVPASRRRLYLVMLGVSGSEKDLPMLEEYIRSSDRKEKSGLDALIACYLTLNGEAGMPLVEELFLKNKKADYADTYAAIMALRFHATEDGTISKARLLEGFHYMLERPELADLVIPDLARWEDWAAMDRLFDLYKNADEKTSWVRVPVINFLRACPLPHAKELLAECEKIDPAAVKRANTFFPTAPSTTPSPDATKATQASPPRVTAEGQLVTYEAPLVEALAPLASNEPTASAHPAGEPRQVASVSANAGAAPAAAIKKSPEIVPNLWAVIGVPWGVGLVLLAMQWTLLRGAGRRR
jgi:hypothetical protein